MPCLGWGRKALTDLSSQTGVARVYCTVLTGVAGVYCILLHCAAVQQYNSRTVQYSAMHRRVLQYSSLRGVCSGRGSCPYGDMSVWVTAPARDRQKQDQDLPEGDRFVMEISSFSNLYANNKKSFFLFFNCMKHEFSKRCKKTEL